MGVGCRVWATVGWHSWLASVHWLGIALGCFASSDGVSRRTSEFQIDLSQALSSKQWSDWFCRFGLRYLAVSLSRRSGTGCLNVPCVQCENGKSISPIDSAQPAIAHDADTDSDLARPPDGKHPLARNATPAMLLRSTTRRRTAGHVVAHPGPSDSEWGHRGAMDGSCSDDSEIEEERAGEGPGPTGGGPEQEDRGRIRADDVYPECWRSIH